MLYKLESEAGIWVNLDGDLDNLHKHQQYLQRLIARATLDLQIITTEIVERQRGEHGSTNQTETQQPTEVRETAAS